MTTPAPASNNADDAREQQEADDPNDTRELDDDGGADDEGDREEAHAPAPPDSPRAAALTAAGVTLATALGAWLAFDRANAASPSLLAPLAVTYALLAWVALRRLRGRRELRLRLQPAQGDLSFAALAAASLYGAGKLVQAGFLPLGTPNEGWLRLLYLFLGNPTSDATRLATGGAVFVIGALEELAWRGLVFDALATRWSTRTAVLATTALYAAAHLPTAFRLAVPGLGPNPLLVGAAVGCGLAWNLAYVRVGRLTPVVLSHGLFSWAMFEFPLWRL
jgi:membrane protease YdiL (CAAX protease family)